VKAHIGMEVLLHSLLTLTINPGIIVAGDVKKRVLLLNRLNLFP
jgi:hypothetical protein